MAWGLHRQVAKAEYIRIYTIPSLKIAYDWLWRPDEEKTCKHLVGMVMYNY